MNEPKSQQGIFLHLAPLVPIMNKFKATKTGALTADQIQLMKDVYPDIQVLCSGCLPRVFNTSCDSCVRDVFEIYISFYDRLSRNPHVNPQAGAEQPAAPALPTPTQAEIDAENERKKAELESSMIMTEAEDLEIKALFEANGLPTPESVLLDPDKAMSVLKDFAFDPESNQALAVKVQYIIPKLQADLDAARKEELDEMQLTEDEEARLLEHLKLTVANTPQEYLSALKNYIDESQNFELSDEYRTKLGNKMLFLELQEVVVEDFTPLNTPETLTPQQKANATKAANKAKKAAK